MDPRIKIKVRKQDGYFVGTVWVNGDFYASVAGLDEDAVKAEVLHYAAQIEFDEWGNW